MNLLDALRDETLPRLGAAREALEKARAASSSEGLAPVRELCHKVAGSSAMAGLTGLSRVCRLGEELALLALEGDAKPSKRLFQMLESVLGTITAELSAPAAASGPPALRAVAAPHSQPAPAEPAVTGRVVLASDENVSAKLILKLLEESKVSARRISLADAAERLPDCELLMLDTPSQEPPPPTIAAALENASKQHVPVLVTTKADPNGVYAARAAAVLTKPVRPDTLDAAVRTLVERRLAVAAARAKAPTGQVPAPAAPAKPLTVLIVDDSRVIRGVVREALAEVGLVAVEAEDGSEALGVFDASRPDAVISDLQMPGVDGAELIALLRERSKGVKVPIVVLSALEDEASRRAGLAAGADAYLVKSIIDGPALLRALKDAGLPLAGK
jgi:DNA-binding response OmpR family regulator